MAGDRRIAVVSSGQTPMVRKTDSSEAQLITRAVTEALDAVSLTRADVDFTCSGSCDYISGQPFSFVQNIDALGAWPPKRDSHVEMDGAWALYEAWLRLLHGDIEIAVVMGSGRSSTAATVELYPMEMDPYYLAPLGADPMSLAALQARQLLDAGLVTEEAMAETAVVCRRAAADNPYAQVTSSPDAAELLSEDFVRDPLRRHDLPPVTDGACAVVLATAERARELLERPAFVAGLEHRAESHYPGMRSLTESPSMVAAARAAGMDDGPLDVAELHAAFSHEDVFLRRVLGLDDSVAVNPSGGALAANPIMATGLVRVAEAARRVSAGSADRALAHATSGPCLQQNLVCIVEGES